MFWDVLERAVLCLVIAANAKDAGQYFANFPFYFSNLTLGRARKFIPHRGTMGGGGMEPPLWFLIFCSILKRFYQWKAFDLLYKRRYILWVVALLGACDVTNNGRHLGFYQGLEIKLKPREMVIFFVLELKNNT